MEGVGSTCETVCTMASFLTFESFFLFFFLVSRKSKTRSSLFYDLIMDSRTPPLSDLQPFFFFLLATGGGWGWDSCVPR